MCLITHPLTPSLILEKGNCGVVIPLYNVREGDRGGELRKIKYLQNIRGIIIYDYIITSLTKGITGYIYSLFSVFSIFFVITFVKNNTEYL